MSTPGHTAHALLKPIDPGYLFLIAGLALLCSAALIPAQQDLAEARFRRDAVLAHERSHQERLNRYENYLGALRANDPAVLESLTFSQLNVLPDRAERIAVHPINTDTAAAVFGQLEPGPPVIPQQAMRTSTLSKLVTDRRSRLWIIAFAAICILYSVLPRTCR